MTQGDYKIIEPGPQLITKAAVDNPDDGTSGVRWDLLNQRHECYNELRMKKLKLLLSGDAANDGNAKLFMKKFQPESDAKYRDRLAFATYENNFGQIINDYGSTLFAKPLAVHPAVDAEDDSTPGDEPDKSEPYMQFQEKFTLDGQKMPDFMHIIQTESNALSYSYFGVDFADDGKVPYCYYIDPCSVLDWEKDDEGKYIFLVLRNDEIKRTAIRQARNEIKTTFTVWKDKDGRITLEKYSIKYPKDQPPKNDTIVPKDGSTKSDMTFKQIPIICAETPDNIAIGKLIGQLAESYFCRYSTYLFAMNRGIDPLLVYKQGAELPANGDLSSIAEDEERGATTVRRAVHEGKAVIGPNDELTWESPDSSAYTVFQTQLEKDKNEMYRLCASLNSIIGHTGFSTAQTKASGIAKLIDNIAKEHMLAQYAKLVKKWVLEAFKIAFDALQVDVEGSEESEDVEGSEESEVVWQCKGMDNYRVVDEDQLMAKIEALGVYKQNMPSITSLKQYIMDIAYDAHPFTNIGTLDKIMNEIEENIDKMDLEDVHQSANPEGALAADSAKQLDKAVPQQKTGSAPKVNSPGGSDLDPKEIGESGHQVGQEDMHLQSNQHIDPSIVYDQLKDDYDDKYIQFVLQIPWQGPVEVPLASLDYSNMTNWEAYGRDDKIEEFIEKVSEEGWTKPIIVVNEVSNNSKMKILDGHTRALAYMQMNKPIPAYVGQVGKVTAEMTQMHDMENSGEKGGKRGEKSNQKVQSQQKEQSNQKKIIKN